MKPQCRATIPRVSDKSICVNLSSIMFNVALWESLGKSAIPLIQAMGSVTCYLRKATYPGSASPWCPGCTPLPDLEEEFSGSVRA